MKRFTVSRNLFEGDTYQCVQKFETEQEFLDWAATKKHLGKRDWWLQKSVDEDGNDVFPETTLEPHESRVRTINVDAYTDEDGVEHDAYSYDVTEYKQVDQWSYTVEDISAEVALQSVLDARKQAYTEAGLDLMKLVEYISENDTEKITEYRALKAQIKAQHPKP